MAVTTNKLNWARVVWCGLLAGVVWILLGSLATALVGRDFAALPNNHLAKPSPGFLLFNVVIDLLEGISILWLYAAIRPRFGAGVKTSMIAVFAWWFIVTLGDATWCSFGLFPARTAIPLMAGTLPAPGSCHACRVKVLPGVREPPRLRRSDNAVLLSHAESTMDRRDCHTEAHACASQKRR